MSLATPPEQKEIGKSNFEAAAEQLSPTRRQFLKGTLAAGAAVGLGVGGYFGYTRLSGNPVRAALIGAGDEGGVLVGEHNPDFLKFVAVCDIRPSNRERIFAGEKPPSPRLGFERIYGANARKDIKPYTDYKDVLNDKNVEAVVIALPLHLHAKVAIDAMKAGKHVLCEKLMAWNIKQCKQMIRAADETGRILTVGHQRHYSLLYPQAVDVIDAGVLGDVKHIRALWHRNNSWPELDGGGKPKVDAKGNPVYRDGWRKAVDKKDREELEAKLAELDYKSMEELVRWRLFQRTGGGLMAELGSHQLDACSIFLGKVHPLHVSGVGGKFFYRDEREIEDHVFVTFEFPGKHYYKPGTREVNDKDDIVVVTYSSINTNAAEPYGETVMGSRATLTVENEQTAMLYPERDPNKKAGDRSLVMTVTSSGGGKPAVDSTATTGLAGPASGVGAGAAAPGKVSRGYREEMEHFAYCVRMIQEAKGDKDEIKKWQQTPRCHGRVAMADAIVALTSNLAMRHNKRIKFEESWFEAGSDDVPDAENKATDAKGKEIEIA